MRERMVDILTERTGQPRERIEADIDRDYILRGDEAVAYGLVDEVIAHRKPRPVPGFHQARGRGRRRGRAPPAAGRQPMRSSER